MIGRRTVFDSVRRELNRAEKLHPVWPNDPIHVVAIVTEECGEAMREAIDVRYFRHGDRDRLEKELVQTAAMAIRALVNIDKIPHKFQSD